MSDVAPLLLTATVAGDFVGLSRTIFSQQLSCGGIGPLPVVVGRRKYFQRQQLAEWTRLGCPNRHVWLRLHADPMLPATADRARLGRAVLNG